MKNPQVSFKHMIFSLGLAFTAGTATADHSVDHKGDSHDHTPSTLKLGVIEGVGPYKLRVDQYGEPAAMPLRLSLEFGCDGDKRPFVAFSDITACGGGEVKADKKNVILSFLKPDKKEKCARKISESIAIADICK